MDNLVFRQLNGHPHDQLSSSCSQTNSNLLSNWNEKWSNHWQNSKIPWHQLSRKIIANEMKISQSHFKTQRRNVIIKLKLIKASNQTTVWYLNHLDIASSYQSSNWRQYLVSNQFSKSVEEQMRILRVEIMKEAWEKRYITYQIERTNVK